MTGQREKIKRVLRWYSKLGDSLIGECWLRNVYLDKLRELFGQATDDPMYDAYPVSKEQIEYLQKYCIDHQIDLNAYDYFVESYEVK